MNLCVEYFFSSYIHHFLGFLYSNTHHSGHMFWYDEWMSDIWYHFPKYRLSFMSHNSTIFYLLRYIPLLRMKSVAQRLYWPQTSQVVIPKLGLINFRLGYFTFFSFWRFTDCTITLVEFSPYVQLFSVVTLSVYHFNLPLVSTIWGDISDSSSVGMYVVKYTAYTFVEKGMNILSG